MLQRSLVPLYRNLIGNQHDCRTSSYQQVPDMLKTIFLIVASALSLLTACYRMPEEGEVSVVPTTNNPSITRQGGGFMPGVEY